MKLNLLSFWQNHIRKIVFLFGMFLTVLFIAIYFKVPSGEYFDFIIYSLAIVYSTIFFILSMIQSLVENSTEAVYNEIKTMFFHGLEVRKAHIISVITSEEKPSPMRINLSSLPSLNLHHYYCSDSGPKFNVPKNLIKFKKLYLIYEKYISSKDWDEEKKLTKLNRFIYKKLQKYYQNRFTRSLRLVEKCYGDRLSSDLQADLEYKDFKTEILLALENIKYDLEQVTEYIKFEEYKDYSTVLTEINEGIRQTRERVENVEGILSDIDMF